VCVCFILVQEASIIDRSIECRTSKRETERERGEEREIETTLVLNKCRFEEENVYGIFLVVVNKKKWRRVSIESVGRSVEYKNKREKN
jgi:hypothetical protein